MGRRSGEYLSENIQMARYICDETHYDNDTCACTSWDVRGILKKDMYADAKAVKKRKNVKKGFCL